MVRKRDLDCGRAHLRGVGAVVDDVHGQSSGHSTKSYARYGAGDRRGTLSIQPQCGRADMGQRYSRQDRL